MFTIRFNIAITRNCDLKCRSNNYMLYFALSVCFAIYKFIQCINLIKSNMNIYIYSALINLLNNSLNKTMYTRVKALFIYSI